MGGRKKNAFGSCLGDYFMSKQNSRSIKVFI